MRLQKQEHADSNVLKRDTKHYKSQNRHQDPLLLKTWPHTQHVVDIQLRLRIMAIIAKEGVPQNSVRAGDEKLPYSAKSSRRTIFEDCCFKKFRRNIFRGSVIPLALIQYIF